MTKSAWAIVSGLFCFAVLAVYTLFWVPESGRVLRIYNWAHYIPDDVIEEFEQREGIRIHYDTFDNLEILEAKLLASHSGYDVVFPPALPTLKLFAPAGIFAKLNLTWLPNAQHLDSDIMDKMRLADPEGVYAMPYLWGTTGLIYNERIVSAVVPDAPRDGWALLFSQKWITALAPYGVVLLDSPADVFPDVLFYKGFNLFDNDVGTLKAAAQYLFSIRPFVYKFDSSQIMQDLLSERVAVAEIFSSYAHMAMARLGESKKNQPYRYVIPKEGALMWIDTMAIPKDSARKRWAHKFINFLMTPRIIAKITNKTYVANAVTLSEPFLNPEVRKTETIYPSPEVRKRLHLDRIPTRSYARMRLRYWTMIRAGYKP